MLTRLIKKNVSINKEKCVFHSNKISYLGYIISNRGIEPDKSKFMPVMSAPDPKNAREPQYWGLYSIIVDLSTILQG